MSFSSLRGPLAALGSSFTWALGTSTYSILTQRHSPYAINFVRAFLACLLFFFTALIFEPGIFSHSVFPNLWPLMGWALVSVIGSYALGDILFLLSTRHLGTADALAIASFYPILAAFFQAFWLHQPLFISQWAGVFIAALSLCGIVKLNLRGKNSAAQNRSVPGARPKLGIFLALAAGTLWAINTLGASQMGKLTSAISANALRMGLAALYCFLACLFISRRAPSAPLPITSLIQDSKFKAVFSVFIIEAYLGSFLFLYGLSRTPLALGNVLVSLAPVIAWLFSVFTGREKFSIAKLLLLLSLLIGITLIVLVP